MTEVIPQQKITYNWKFEGYQGNSDVSFELSPTNGQTELTLTSVVNESFTQDIPEFKRESGVAGWTYFIQNSLKEYIDRVE